MNFVALISGGKDSCFTISHCLAQGHHLVALANLYPAVDSEIDSFMYQTVGYNIIENYSQCIGVPIYRKRIDGSSKNTEMQYITTLDDETEDLYDLLSTVKDNHPELQAVSVGAILSNYQRIRVEHVCQRLNLTCLAFLWQAQQDRLMQQMVNVSGMNAVIIKVAAYGLDSSHLGMTINQLYPKLVQLNKMFDVHICGEGGEFETIVLDAPFFLKKYMKISKKEIITHSSDVFYLKLDVELVEKPDTIDKSLKDFDGNYWKQFVIEPSFLNEKFQNLYNRIELEEIHESRAGTIENHDESVIIISPTKILRLEDKLYISNLSTTNVQLSVEDQAKDIFYQLLKVLRDYNLDASYIISTSLLVRSMHNFAKINQIYTQYFTTPLPPARTCIETILNSELSMSFLVSKLPKNGLHVQSRSYWAPSNIGPYSQATQINSIANLSGQIPLIAKDMTLQFLDFKLNCLLSFQHLNSVMEVINCTNVMSVVCYFSDMRYKSIGLKLWKQIYDDMKKNLIMVHVNSMPKDALIEWSAITCNDSDPSMSYEEKEEKASDEKCLIISKYEASTTKKNGEFVSVCYFNSDEELEKLITNNNSCHFVMYTKHNTFIAEILSKANSAEFIPVKRVFDNIGNEIKYGVIIRGYL